jgi:hypothetical protein
VARLAGVVTVTITLLWLVVAVGLVAIIGLEQVSQSDRNCPVPGVESLYGDSSWQWWPPGEVCTLNHARLSGPSALRGWAIGAEVLVGLVLVVGWRRLRDVPDPDWAA